MNGTDSEKRSKEVKKTTNEFIRISQKTLTPPEFRSGTLIYSGSINPGIEASVRGASTTSGAIPVALISNIYKPGTVLDLSSVAESVAKTPSQVIKLENVRKKTEDSIKEEELYDRVAEYQDSLMRLASCSNILRDTIKMTSESDDSWVQPARTNLEWVKKSVTKSVARIYQAFGKLFDKVTDKIDELAELLGRWANNLKTQLIEKLRELSERFLELMNNLIAGLFNWIATLRKIAQERGFKLTKVTLTIDPISFESVTAFEFSIPVPVLKLPKIQMEFT